MLSEDGDDLRWIVRIFQDHHRTETYKCLITKNSHQR